MHLRDLSPASFRGVAFLCPKDTAEEGRNSIKHSYPDASHRYVEDNGLIPPEFKLTAILHGADLPAKVRSLRGALNTPGPGTLRHPYYGSHLCAVIGPYHVSRSDDDSGVVTFEITFAVTGAAIFPGLVGAIPAVVTGLALSTISSIASLLPAAFGAGPLSSVSRDVIGAGMAGIGTALNGQFSSVDASRMIEQASNLASDPDRFGSLLDSAMSGAIGADEGTISSARLASGFQSTFDAASSLVNQALVID